MVAVRGTRLARDAMMRSPMNYQRPCLALIVAAGRGTRAGEGVAKQYRPLDGQPVLRRALAPFLAHPGVDGVCADPINLQQVMEDNIDLIRVPTDPNGVNKYGEIIMGANIGISAHSKHPEAVAQLINFWLNDLEFNKLYNNDHGITGKQAFA